MNKIVPDPPSQTTRRRVTAILQQANADLLQVLNSQRNEPSLLETLKETAARPGNLRDGRHRSLFDVKAGINAETTLNHVSLLLRCAEEVSDEITEQGSGIERGLIWSMVHSVEMARALVDALLEGTQPACTQA
ncbi:DUF3077 domain-containing protein [Pseudomonas fuscovaginae UPB0736]|uniref:DUF6124 family protein n=1 Tax=Pseudomonas asplenii TaxID=53407 RepID=UPI00028A1BB1|nr:DUF3077 domain-containing protein [Pseudomonas fuscovaginae]UUQ67639.1 DUF3077 domain-containing protein [Pseudomonas fuscovaginae UPB0736]